MLRNSLREHLRQKKIDKHHKATISENPCSDSMGVVRFIHHEPSQTELIKWADAGMGNAINAGCNATQIYA